MRSPSVTSGTHFSGVAAGTTCGMTRNRVIGLIEIVFTLSLTGELLVDGYTHRRNHGGLSARAPPAARRPRIGRAALRGARS